MEHAPEPASKQDIDDVRAEMVELESRLKSYVDGRLDAQETRIGEKLESVIRDTETRQLKAFYAFAEGNTARLADLESSDAALVRRMAGFEARLTEVEKRLNIPPAASSAGFSLLAPVCHPW